LDRGSEHKNLSKPAKTQYIKELVALIKKSDPSERVTLVKPKISSVRMNTSKTQSFTRKPLPF
jgi:hypothetical protein